MKNFLKYWKERRLKRKIFFRLLQNPKYSPGDIETVDVIYRYLAGTTWEEIVSEYQEPNGQNVRIEKPFKPVY
jgi:hypothetical protein